LLLSIKSDDTTVREVISRFDGCTGKAGEIAGEFRNRSARTLTRAEAARVLSRAKAAARMVKPERLGHLAEDTFPGAHAKVTGSVEMHQAADGTRAQLPIVIQVWADPDASGSQATFMINGTPCVTDANAYFVEKSKTTMFHGPGLRFS